MTTKNDLQDVLSLLATGETENLDTGDLRIVHQLARNGLAEWRGETPALTAEGWRELDRRLAD